MADILLMPRILRLKHAPSYVGTNINFFNEIIRPNLTEIPLGSKGVGFDRHELDHWVDVYKKQYGRKSSR